MLGKIEKRIILSVIYTLVLSASLLLAGAAQAETVILDENDNAIQIKNLEVVLDQGGSTIFDVDFVNDTGFNVYGVPLALPFTEEDAIIVQISVNSALNANNPVPTGAGPLGTNQHFVGGDVDPLTGFIGGIGGEYFTRDGEWDKCDTDCILGVKPLDPSSS